MEKNDFVDSTDPIGMDEDFSWAFEFFDKNKVLTDDEIQNAINKLFKIELEEFDKKRKDS